MYWTDEARAVEIRCPEEERWVSSSLQPLTGHDVKGNINKMFQQELSREKAAKRSTFKPQIGIILLIVGLSAGCGAGGHHNNVIPPNDWQIVTYNWVKQESHLYSLSDYPWSAGLASDGTVWFMFPNYSSADEAFRSENVVRLWQNYSDRSRSLETSTNLTYDFSISAEEGVTFFWKTQTENVCKTPPTARPMLLAWYVGSYQPTGMWWADSAFTLAPESGTVNFSLAPDHWTDVYGTLANRSRGTLKDFNFAKNNLQAYGMSFGGGCFYGHGVSTIGGTARFEAHVKPDLESK